MKLERTVDPAVNAIATTLVEESLAISSGENANLVANYIDSAQDDLEIDTDRALISQTWRMTLDRFPARQLITDDAGTMRETIFLPKGPILSISTFDYLDVNEESQSLVAGTDYNLTSNGDFPRIEPIGNWPATFSLRNDVVTIDIVVGLGVNEAAMPGWVKTALLLKIKGLYDDCFEIYEDAYNSAIITRKLFFDFSKNDR